MSIEQKPLEELVQELTPQARLELRDFAEFLWHKQKRASKRGLRQDWAGAPRDPQLPAGATAEVIVLLNSPLVESSEATAPTRVSLIGAAQGGFATPEEVDRFLNQERDAWA